MHRPDGPSRFACLVFMIAAQPAGLAAIQQSLDDVTLWRSELTLKVCDKNRASTDARITASLGQGETILNLGRDDFQRGRWYSYDLPSPGLIRDIRELRITNHGRDRVCFDAVVLAVNHASPETRDELTLFTSESEVWLSNRSGEQPEYLVDAETLRQSPRWNSDGPRRTLLQQFAGPIPRETLEQMIETLVGDAVARDSRIGWGRRSGDRYVTLRREGAQTARVDLDLGRRGRDTRLASIDVDFNLTVTCDSDTGELRFEVSDADADARRIPFRRLFERGVEDEINNLGRGLNPVNVGDPSICEFIRPHFDASGNLRLI